MSAGGIYSIGHSTHPADRFVALLELHAIDVVADVRSHPSSRFNPQFGRERLAGALRRAGIGYEFLGRALGARADDPACRSGGRVSYGLLAARAEFRDAIARLDREADDRRIALMCAEREPLDCHRAILVSQALAGKGRDVLHILHDGSVEAHGDALDRLLRITGLHGADLFKGRDELVEEALARQEARIAPRAPEDGLVERRA